MTKLPLGRGVLIVRWGDETVFIANHGRDLFSLAAVKCGLAIGQIDRVRLQKLISETWSDANFTHLPPGDAGCEEMMMAILMTLEFGSQGDRQ